MTDATGAGAADDTAHPDAKRALRARVRAARAARAAGHGASSRSSPSPSPWHRAVLALVDERAATTVALYSSYGTEPPTAGVVDALVRRGTRVLLPVTLADKDLDWVDAAALPAAPATPLRETDVDPSLRLGREAVARAGLVVVPALAVGRDGARLGQGGGSYDRALARVPADVPVVALVHDDELLGAGVVPAEPHDRLVTHAVTPTGVVTCGQADPSR